MKIDFGRTSEDYARHRQGFPESFFDRVARLGVGLPGQAALDLGTGTGTLALGLARRGCAVTALDIAEPQLREAERRAREEELSARFLQAPAEQTGLPDRSFDVVVAGQCWHWFDRPAAIAEVRRLLRPGGRVLIAHLDWIPLRGNLVEMMEDLVERYNPAQPRPQTRFGQGVGIYAPWVRDVQEAGFTDIETFSYDLELRYTHEAWRGRVRASQGVGASLPPEAVARFDEEHARLLAERFPEDPLAVPHRIWAVVGAAPA